MRTVTLEILRQGPPNNQLLSPLTSYLGLCGDQAAESIRLPYVHSEFLARLRSLRYKDSNATREAQLAGTARELMEILGQIRGLVRELADARADGAETVHLRLVLSAQELALLPFELATSPNGWPGAGQPFALQTELPICVTREVRRVRPERIEWPEKPCILFAFASPVGVGDVPWKAHLQALRRAINPWVRYYRTDEERTRRRAELLKVLPRASVVDLQRECQTGRYTHIHILAHGVPFTDADDRRYGIALHHRQDPIKKDIVPSENLATLVRSQVPSKGGDLARPCVVTVASCDSGNVGSVVGAGASVAHALHEGGIPLVVASQFPLSFAGSVVMTETLYEGLMAGEDPRRLIDRTRRRLKTGVPDTHDWASLLAYASLPDDIDRRVADSRVSRAHWRMEAALNHAFGLVWPEKESKEKEAKRFHEVSDRDQESIQKKDIEEKRFQDVLGRVKDSIQTLNGISGFDQDKGRRSRIEAKLGSSYKRLAEIHWETHRKRIQPQSTDLPDHMGNPIDALKQARRHYEKAFELDASSVWYLVQALALKTVLEGAKSVQTGPDDFSPLEGGQFDLRLWRLAESVSLQDVRSDDKKKRAWAYGNLIELYLMTRLCAWQQNPDYRFSVYSIDEDTLAGLAAKNLRRLVDRDDFALRSTRTQVRRYREFLPGVAAAIKPQDPNKDAWPRVHELMEEILKTLNI
jgi:hypothetical protein